MAKYASKVVAGAQAWLGRKESDGSHREIIDIYNAHKPLARGYKVTYTDAWCATFVSAVAIKLGYTDIIPTECGCPKMIELFKNLLKHYKNTILYHGHSHMHFDMQKEVSNSNYSEVLGFRSIHVPSISWSRKIVNGASVNAGGCYGYLVDVYEDFIILNGFDLMTNSIVPISTYKIDTKLVEIEANTFKDSTNTLNI